MIEISDIVIIYKQEKGTTDPHFFKKVLVQTLSHLLVWTSVVTGHQKPFLRMIFRDL